MNPELVLPDIPFPTCTMLPRTNSFKKCGEDILKLMYLGGTPGEGDKVRRLSGSDNLPEFYFDQMTGLGAALKYLQSNPDKPDIVLLDCSRLRSSPCVWINRFHDVVPEATMIVLTSARSLDSNQVPVGHVHEHLVKGEAQGAALVKLVLRTHENRWLQRRFEGQTESVNASSENCCTGVVSESMELVQSILDSMPPQIAILDEEGTIVIVNRAWKTFLLANGLSPDAVGIGSNYLNASYPAYSEEAAEEFNQGFFSVVSGEEETFQMEYRHQSSDQERWYRCSLFRVNLNNQIRFTVNHLEITQDKLVSLKQKESEERFHLAMKGAQDGLFDWDLKTGKVYHSPMWLSLFGYKSDELDDTPDSWRNLLHPDDRLRVEQHLANFIERKSSKYEFEYRMIHRAGHVVSVATRALLVRDELTNEPVRLVGTLRDVSERKAAEENLRRTVGRLEGLTGIINHGCEVTYTNLKGNIIHANNRFCKISGYNRDELLGQNHRMLKSGVHKKDYFKDLWSTVSQGDIWNGEICNRAKDGTEYWMDATIGPYLDGSGKRLGYIAVRFDINERKQAELKLKKSKLFLDAVVDNLPFSILTKDARSFRYLRMNKAFENLHGVESKEVIGKTASEIWPVEMAQKIDDFDRHIYETNQIEVREEYIETEHLGTRWLQATKVPVPGVDGTPEFILGIYVDITEQRTAADKEAILNTQLREASHRAGMAEVATNVLHNVGNVLNSVNVSVSLLNERISDMNKLESFKKVIQLLKHHEDDLPGFFTLDERAAHIPKYLESFAVYLQELKDFTFEELRGLRSNVDHIKSIVIMQQNLAKLGGYAELLTAVDLFEDALHFSQAALERHHLEVIKEFEEIPPFWTDRNQVLQILVNLISNAKYAYQDITDRPKRVVLGIRRRGDQVEFSVTDHGMGIAEENLSRIFNHGFTTRKNGHGFGLHGSANAAHELGGNLRVHSGGLGEGASFTLTLPLTPKDKTSQHAGTDRDRPAKSHLPRSTPSVTAGSIQNSPQTQPTQ